MPASPRSAVRRLFATAVCAAALLVTGCEAAREVVTPDVQARGNLPRPDVLEQIEPGRQSRAEIAQLLGTPSTRSAFGPEVWYYISRTSQPLLFLPPQTLDQRVIAIRFDEAGRVSEVKNYSLDDAQDVQIVNRHTPTRGSELSIMQQLLGNLGRFEN